MSERIDCAAFDDGVGELALDLLNPCERDALMAHASGCNRCRSELESIASLADLLVTVAPQGEPPVGFEQRAVDAMVGTRPRVGSKVGFVIAAAAASVVIGLIGALVGRSTNTSDPRAAALERVGIHSARSAKLVGSGGIDHGSVLLTSGPDVLLTMRLIGLDSGRYHCVLRGTDGSTTEVAAWPIGESGGGTWAVALDRPLPAVRQVLVTEDDGSTVAVAAFP